LLHAYETGGFGLLSELHGSFAAAIWDAQNRRVTLLTDRLGSRPLYYVRMADRILFSSSIKSLLSDPGVSREPDWQGIAQFFTFGHYLRNNTSLQAVHVLPPASSLTYDLDGGETRCRPYWSLQKAAAGCGENWNWLDAIDEKLQSAVSRCLT